MRDDVRFMRRALELARRGRGRVEPNPMVGAVIVKEMRIVGEGWHAEYGGPHAEIAALEAAGPEARGATVYVSLEPCSHQGKTPPCTDALIEAGVARVVFAAGDPNPAARGGAERLREAGIDVTPAIEELAARDLNARFFHAFTPESRDRPFVELKLALSIDGKVADVRRRSSWITGDAARAEVHRMRAAHDAVGVGIGTVLADDPLLTVRGDVAPNRPPLRVVFDRRLRIPLDSRLVTTARDTPLLVIGGRTALPQSRELLETRGVRVEHADDLRHALRILRAAGVRSLMMEGGAELASAFLTHKRVDRLSMFIAPLMLGATGVDPFAGIASEPIADAPRWRHIETAVFGGDTHISFAP